MIVAVIAHNIVLFPFRHKYRIQNVEANEIICECPDGIPHVLDPSSVHSGKIPQPSVGGDGRIHDTLFGPIFLNNIFNKKFNPSPKIIAHKEKTAPRGFPVTRETKSPDI